MWTKLLIVVRTMSSGYSSLWSLRFSEKLSAVDKAKEPSLTNSTTVPILFEWKFAMVFRPLT